MDLIHSGTRGKEIFGIEEIVAEPIWPGTRAHLVDTTGFGKYRFRVFDQATGKEIFSQGYCTLFGEWLSTEEAKTTWRSMTEPVRMPFPKAPVELVMETRDDKTGEFVEIQRMKIDTTAYDIRRDRRHDFAVTDLHASGRPASSAVDVVIIPDGYTAAGPGQDAPRRQALRRRLPRPRALRSAQGQDQHPPGEAVSRESAPTSRARACSGTRWWRPPSTASARPGT